MVPVTVVSLSLEVPDPPDRPKDLLLLKLTQNFHSKLISTPSPSTCRLKIQFGHN